MDWLATDGHAGNFRRHSLIHLARFNCSLTFSTVLLISHLSRFKASTGTGIASNRILTHPIVTPSFICLGFVDQLLTGQPRYITAIFLGAPLYEGFTFIPRIIYVPQNSSNFIALGFDRGNAQCEAKKRACI